MKHHSRSKTQKDPKQTPPGLESDPKNVFRFIPFQTTSRGIHIEF